MDAEKALQDMLLRVLDHGYYQATEHLIESLRIEHGEPFDTIVAEYARRHALSRCGAFMSQITVVSTTLKTLADMGLVERKTEEGGIFWRLSR